MLPKPPTKTASSEDMSYSASCHPCALDSTDSQLSDGRFHGIVLDIYDTLIVELNTHWTPSQRVWRLRAGW
jgi:hypothetical protein